MVSAHGFVTIGIQRDEREKDRGCCFDHTVAGGGLVLPWSSDDASSHVPPTKGSGGMPGG